MTDLESTLVVDWCVIGTVCKKNSVSCSWPLLIKVTVKLPTFTVSAPDALILPGSLGKQQVGFYSAATLQCRAL